MIGKANTHTRSNMPKRPTQHRPMGYKPFDRKAFDERRGSSSSRGYGATWRKFRERWLKEHPLCVYCQRENRVTAATVVDHIIPHRGDMELFWLIDNVQSLCHSHHNSIKQREENEARKPK